jgi:hypothetical protein
MASLAQIDEFYHSPRGIASNIGRYLVTDSNFRRPGSEMKQFDTRLRSGIKLMYTGELSPVITEAVKRIAELEQREPGWDSYGGRSLNDKAVHSGFRLIVAGFKMCQNPRIQLNGAGELDLIWESESRYLEITAHADGSYDVSFEDQAADEDFESDEPVAYGVAQHYLARFCSIG